MKKLALTLVLAAICGQAGAVGLGPLNKSGTIDGPREAFYLTLYNPYHSSVEFVTYAIAEDSDEPQSRVTIYPDDTVLGSERSRQLVIIANDLTIGETYKFRVCAQRKTPPEGIMINARVCSKISARRVG